MRYRDGSEVVISRSPDNRLFGAGCFETRDVTNLFDLCHIMIEHLKREADWRYYFSAYNGKHLGLTVAGALDETSNEEQFRDLCGLLVHRVEQFNWHDVHDASDRRFMLCQIRVLAPAVASEVEPGLPPVTMPRGLHVCGTREL